MGKYLGLLGLVILLIQCRPSSEEPKAEIQSQQLKEMQLNWAKSIALQEDKDYFILAFEGVPQKTKIPKSILPISSCWVANTSTIGYLEVLDELNKVKGVASPQYIYSENIRKIVENNEILTIGDDLGWNVEKLIQSNTRFIFCSYNPNFLNTYRLLEAQGFYMIFIEEYRESEPLARAEYLKVIGKLMGKSERANDIFTEIESAYLMEKEKSNQSKFKPKVLSKIMYGDIWYMPGGQSYSAHLYKDAGGDYPWAKTSHSESLRLSFEEVFEKANDASVWVEVSDVAFKTQLLAQNNMYENFQCFRSGAMFSLSGRKKGEANDFYESGVVAPQKIIKELRYIFQNYQKINKDSLFYFHQLQ